MIPLHLQIAKNLLGMKEIGNNEGFDNKEFESYLRSKFKWKNGYSWCAYFVGFCLDIASVKAPLQRGGLARNYYTHGYSPYKDIKLIEVGDLIIWQKNQTINGHIGIIESINEDGTVNVIEGNTSNGDKGSQDNGDGVYLRKRKLNFTNPAFHVLGFSKVKYE